MLTGDRPTGRLHLGHYVGTLKERIRLQEVAELFIVLADYHALTTERTAGQLARVAENLREIVLDYLSVGIDPKKTTIYVQSEVPEVCELQLIFSMLVSVAEAQRVPTLKDLIRVHGLTSPSMGLLGYPILQSADILLMRAETVPVGRDQEPHIELCREIARRFNNLYGKVFPEPRALIGEVPLLVGIDGKEKMSKTLGNAIYLTDTAQEVGNKVMRMYTDPKRIHPTDPGTVEGNPVFIYHETFNTDRAEVEELKQRYRAGRVGDVEVKMRLEAALNRFLGPIRAARGRYAADPETVPSILSAGRTRARREAAETLRLARQAMRLDYRFDPAKSTAPPSQPEGSDRA
ncbi:MAG TPA: tryptophan--tRNA ligase [Candidatus Eisenbacteria bacterium]|nr:tryptophan--tRNA ligase [Candidatus Eisenbacteria bacterium]